MTSDDNWLYKNKEYIEAHERQLRESKALVDLLGEMAWTPSTPEELERMSSQSAKRKIAGDALRELRARLMAAQSLPHQAPVSDR
jgi:hypothetical protein